MKKEFEKEILNIIDEKIQDEELKKDLKKDLVKHLLALELVEHSWLQKNWRPLVMISFAGMIVYNYVFSSIFGFTPMEIPNEVFQVIKIGLGFYVTGRTVEKIMALKGK